jgi:hypothetical protein
MRAYACIALPLRRDERAVGAQYQISAVRLHGEGHT